MKRFLFSVLGITVLGALITNLPLSWAGSAAIPKSENLQPVFMGTIWNGTIANIPQIGSIKTKVSPLALITGKPPVQFSSKAPYLNFSGQAGLGGRLSALVDGDMRGLASVDGRFAGVSGRYDLNIAELILKDSCISGAGAVSTDVLTRNAALWEWQGPDLSGPISCENGDLVLSLTGSDELQDITAIIRVAPSGTYRAEIDVISRDPRAGSVLPLFGFEQSGQGYRLNEAGRWF